MIAPINFLWKQFNGPQIIAFCRAIYNWLKNAFDPTLNYFNTFSIDTATDDHLTTIGTLMGVKRPLIDTSGAEETFQFTATKESSINGFGNDEKTFGGKFADVTKLEEQNTYISDEYYRPLLKTISTGKGLPGSLILIDEICSYFYDTYRPNDTKDYWIYHELDNLDAEKGYMVGDILLFLDYIGDWGNNALFIHAIMDVLNLYSYAPLPSLFHLFEKYSDNPLFFKFSEVKESSDRGWATSKEQGDGGLLS